MGQAPIKKVAFFFPKDSLSQVLECLQQSRCLEMIQVTETAPVEADTGPIEEKLAALKEAIDFLSEAGRVKSSWLENFLVLPEPVKESDFYKAKSDNLWLKQLGRLREIKRKKDDLRRKLEQLQADENYLSPWRDLAVPLDRLRGGQQVAVLVGAIANKKLIKLEENWPAQLALCHKEMVGRGKDLSRIILVYHKSSDKDVRDFLSGYDFTAASFPASPLTVAQILADNRQKQRGCRRQEAALTAEARKYLGRLPVLKMVYDDFLIQKGRTEALAKTGQTARTTFIKGWIRQSDEDRLLSGLRRITPVVLVEAELDEGEVPPVALQNKRFFEPFEAITRMFGAPAGSEIDPSAVLGVFFLLFFGLCLGDIGYGLMLIASTYWLLRRPNLSWGARAVLRFLFWGGWSTLACGLVLGSFFGIDFESIPMSWGGLRQILLSLRLFNPLKDPLRLLFFSFGLGILQVLVGLFLQFLNFIRKRDYLAAFCDSLGWIYFLVMILTYTAGNFYFPGLKNIILILVLLGAVQLVLTQGRHKPTLPAKFGSGLLSLYKLSGFLGDILSYSRLLALGMTSAVIGMVVNMIAQMVWQSLPWIGIVLGLVILVGGHILNFMISVLGATIHSLRLQLVEFFGKFFGGGGKVFRPFSRETHYTLIE